MVCGWQTRGNIFVSYWTDTCAIISETIYQYQKFELPIQENAKVMLIWHPIIVHVA